MAYASASDVVALCYQLIPQETMFSTSTSPTLDQVNSYLSSGCAVIETHLSANGYDVPVASGTAVYDWLRDINTYWAAAHAELSRMSATIEVTERNRGQYYETLFWKNLEKLLGVDLAITGATSRISTGTIYVGGISVADKQTKQDDTDRVKPRFSRGQFDFPGIFGPGETRSEEE